MATEKTLLTSPTYGRCLFDAVFRINHSMPITVTQHPVQSGSAVADHAFREPEEVVLEIGMSDVARTLGTIGSGSLNRSVKAFDVLRDLANRMEPLTVTSRLHTYPSMLITSIEASDDVNTMYALKATVSLTTIRIVAIARMSIQQTCSSTKIEYQDAEEQSETYSGGGDVGSTYIPSSPSVESFDNTSSVSSKSYTSSTSSGQKSGSSTSSNTSVLKDLWNKLTG